jgi:hypothetical protein
MPAENAVVVPPEPECQPDLPDHVRGHLVALIPYARPMSVSPDTWTGRPVFMEWCQDQLADTPAREECDPERMQFPTLDDLHRRMNPGPRHRFRYRLQLKGEGERAVLEGIVKLSEQAEPHGPSRHVASYTFDPTDGQLLELRHILSYQPPPPGYVPGALRGHPPGR